jgi:hypothetical protein
MVSGCCEQDEQRGLGLRREAGGFQDFVDPVKPAQHEGAAFAGMTTDEVQNGLVKPRVPGPLEPVFEGGFDLGWPRFGGLIRGQQETAVFGAVCWYVFHGFRGSGSAIQGNPAGPDGRGACRQQECRA